MSVLKHTKWFLAIVAVMILTACGGGSTKVDPKEAALDLISTYADNGSVVPDVQDYVDAGITDVTVNNLDEVNDAVLALDAEAADTTEEIQDIVVLALDNTPPVITLEGNSTMELVRGTAYSESGATATDDIDETVSVVTSGSVDINTVGTYTLTYKAKDSAGNEAVVTRTVNVVLAPDTTKPVITLNGLDTTELTQGTAYSELGATAIDDRDGNLTVTVSGNVDVNTVGSYTLTYTVTDSAGNQSTLTRTIDVILSKSTISGHIEDDPMPNATITVTNASGDTVVETKADANGKYTLEAPFEEGKTYTLESTGQLGDRNITLHSIFKFSSDTIINANPLTELKYQLVQSGKTIEEAEALVRDYFTVVNGEKLERNRFDIEGSLALGMVDLAKLYDGALPVDAILKIKEDILRNDALDANETKEYSYRTLVQNKIELETSATSLKLGEEVTVTVVGLSELNENYTLKWSGIPENATGGNGSKTFTMLDTAQDVYVSATLYKMDGNISRFISTSNVAVNFYKAMEEQNLTIEDGSQENNLTVSHNLSLTVPAGTMGSGSVLKVTELQTNSETTVGQFAIDENVDENVIFNYKYDPYLVADPRNLQISLRSGGDVKVVNVSEIDYENHLVKFTISMNDGINRAFLDYEIVIEQVDTAPTHNDISVLYGKSYKIINEVIEKYFGEDTLNAQSKLKLNAGTTTNYTYAKYLKVMQSKTNNTYNFNLFARALNNIIAFKESENIIREGWRAAQEAYDNYHNNGCEYLSFTSRGGFRDNGCGNYQSKYAQKIVDLNKLISSWVGYSRLTEVQTGNLLMGNIAVDFALQVFAPIPTTKLQYLSYLAEAGGVLGGYFIPDDLSQDKVSNLYNGFQRTAFLIFDGIPNGTSAARYKLAKKAQIKHFLKSFGIDVLKSAYFEQVKTAMLESNAIKSAPIILAVQKHFDELNVNMEIDSNDLENFQTLSAKSFTKDEFFSNFLPDYNYWKMEECLRNPPSVYEALDENHVCYSFYYNLILNYMYGLDDINDNWSTTHTFGELVDVNGRLSRLFLDGQNKLSLQDRASAFIMMSYAFGKNSETADAINKNFKNLLNMSYLVAGKFLTDIYFMPNTEILETITTSDWFGNTTSKIQIKTAYEISGFQMIKNTLRSISNSVSIKELKNVETFETLMEQANLKLTDTQLETYTIKKVRVEAYGMGLVYSEDDNAWTLDVGDKVHHVYESTEDINSKFTYDDESEKNVLSLATLFDGEDFSQFDDKLVGIKVSVVVGREGKADKVVDGELVFTTLSDTEHLVETDFEGATLKSSIKDASTGSPIEHAQVTLVPGGLTDFTDAEGNYEVSGLAAGNYTIIISKEGYSQVEAQLTLVEDETKVYEASLVIDDEHATSLGGANITLKDAINGNVVTNGYVKVREGQNNKTGEVVQEILNDGNSSVNIEMYPNVYTLEVGANGYTKSYNTVTILGDINGSYEFSITPVLSEDQVRVVLSWGESPSDLDSHLVRKTDGNEDYHVAYYDMNPSNADANLDTDDTSSYGPETITINNLSNASTYKYYVHDFSNGSNHDDEIFKTSGAKVEVYYGDQSQAFYVPNENGNAWKVFEIVNGQIEPCTSGCMFGVDGEEDANIGLRSLDRNALDAHYFKNLPSK